MTDPYLAAHEKKIHKLRAERREHFRIVARHRAARVKSLSLGRKAKAAAELRIIRRHRKAAQVAKADIRALEAEKKKHNWLVRKARNARKVRRTSGTLTWVDGHQVATWIAEIILRARREGVHFTVTSGIRTLATAQYLWNNASRLGLIHYVSVAYPCSSNHCGAVYPKGAVDLSPPWAFIAWLRREHAHGRATNLKSYHDTVGGRDDVHFSHTGH